MVTAIFLKGGGHEASGRREISAGQKISGGHGGQEVMNLVDVWGPWIVQIPRSGGPAVSGDSEKYLVEVRDWTLELLEILDVMSLAEVRGQLYTRPQGFICGQEEEITVDLESKMEVNGQ